MATVKCSKFVKRQTKNSSYSHFEGSWKDLEEMAERYLNGYDNLFIRSGYRDGVILIDLPGWMFKSSIVKLDEDSVVTANFSPRLEKESPCIKIFVEAEKETANYASLVLYRADVLEEDNDRSSNADWEIVAIKARMTAEEEPMDPYTMARNFLHLSGGTKGNFSATEFAQSILYWNNHGLAISKSSWWKRFLNCLKNKK